MLRSFASSEEKAKLLRAVTEDIETANTELE